MSRPKQIKKRCLLCDARLAPTASPEFWLHAESDACKVRVTDGFGVSVDDRYFFDPEQAAVCEYEDGTGVTVENTLSSLDPAAELADIISFQPTYVAVDIALERIFDNAGLPRLGGASGGRGWSSISTFQRCPYLWKRRYVNPEPSLGGPGPTPLEVGSLLHTFRAVTNARKIDPSYPLEAGQVRDALLAAMCSPENVLEGWRLHQAYEIKYVEDEFIPLAVEYHVVDPRTGRSCRYDLIAYKENPSPGLLPGTYLFELKSTAAFTAVSLGKWKNDGEIIGEWELYQDLKLEKRFGPLQGLCVDIVGKQKEPKFERVFLRPTGTLLRDHKKSMAIWSARLDLAKAQNDFPRSRSACAAGHSLCEFIDHCSQETSE